MFSVNLTSYRILTTFDFSSHSKDSITTDFYTLQESLKPSARLYNFHLGYRGLLCEPRGQIRPRCSTKTKTRYVPAYVLVPWVCLDIQMRFKAYCGVTAIEKIDQIPTLIVAFSCYIAERVIHFLLLGLCRNVGNATTNLQVVSSDQQVCFRNRLHFQSQADITLATYAYSGIRRGQAATPTQTLGLDYSSPLDGIGRARPKGRSGSLILPRFIVFSTSPHVTLSMNQLSHSSPVCHSQSFHRWLPNSF